MIIESFDNSKLKLVRKLNRKKTRHKEGKYIIEGLRLVEHAMSLDADFSFILFSTSIFEVKGGKKLIKSIYEKGVEYAQVDDILFSKISDTVNSQGVIAVIDMRSKRTEKDYASLGNKGVFVDRIQDPGNIGTIIRTADAAGFNEIFISKGSVDPYNQKAVRAAMGSILNVNIHFVNDSIETIKNLNLDGYQIIGTDASSKESYNEIDYNEKVILIVGNEGSGIEDSLLSIADVNVNIPISGKAESLNASIATGIVMYKIKEVLK